MKNYKQVIADRYDGLEKGRHVYENKYALINPVGFYTTRRLREVFYRVLNRLREDGMDLPSLRILDVGCGKGAWTRFFSEISEEPTNICGMDLSKYRVEESRRMNPGISYLSGDVCDLPKFDNLFDLALAMDVMEHLGSKEDLHKALRSIHDVLTVDGIFIWYDLYSRDHFSPAIGIDSEGFHPEQMIDLCRECGFKLWFQMDIFRRLPNGKHSVYLSRKYPFWFITLLEKILPGPPGNMLMVFRKTTAHPNYIKENL